MSCILEIKLTTSDIVAIVAFLIAGLSALYTRWSWYEAKKANHISLLGHKKEIYDAFYDLKMYMNLKHEFAEQSEVSKFYYHSKSANIYLPFSLAADINKYFDACFWIANNYTRYGSLTSECHKENKQHLETEKELGPKIEQKLIKMLQEVQA